MSHSDRTLQPAPATSGPLERLTRALFLAALIAGGLSISPSLGQAPGQSTGLDPAWFGRWAGPARVITPAGGPSFTTELRIEPIANDAAPDANSPSPDPAKPSPDRPSPARWTWTIIYEGAAGRQERPYQLRAVDPAKGLYEIDERNGIVLPATLLVARADAKAAAKPGQGAGADAVADAAGEASLHSSFVVGTTHLLSSYRLGRDPDGTPTITLEIISSRISDATTGGGDDPDAKPGIPKVGVYNVVSVQRSVMRRLPPETAPAQPVPPAPPSPAAPAK